MINRKKQMVSNSFLLFFALIALQPSNAYSAELDERKAFCADYAVSSIRDLSSKYKLSRKYNYCLQNSDRLIREYHLEQTRKREQEIRAREQKIQRVLEEQERERLLEQEIDGRMQDMTNYFR